MCKLLRTAVDIASADLCGVRLGVGILVCACPDSADRSKSGLLWAGLMPRNYDELLLEVGISVLR